MRFPFFSPRGPQQVAADRQWISRPAMEQDDLSLTLHRLLENLPQSYSGKENLRRMCQTLLAEIPGLRCAWIGFCEGHAEWVEPYAAVGVQECADWCLPQVVFEAAGPYSQGAPPAASDTDRLLFSPWRTRPPAERIACALALPLRTDRQEVRGIMVLYADTADYFSRLGIKTFRAFGHVAEIIWKQSELLGTLTRKAQLDALTGTMTRRRTMYVLERAVEHAASADEPMSIVLCRIEGFSKINDLYGWMAADAILAAAARELTAQLRPHDRIGRWTGVEFLCVLANTGSEESEARATVMQDYFLAHPIHVRDWSIRLALVTGAATYAGGNYSVDELIQNADRSMRSALQPG